MVEDWYAKKVKESNEDVKTLGAYSIKVDLTEKQYKELTSMALSVGFDNAAELLSSLTGDLTCWHDNGSDERRMAEEWFDRAFGIWSETKYFFKYFLHEFDYDIKEHFGHYENEEDLLEDIDGYYEEYVENAFGKECESKEECIKIIKESLKDKE